MDKPVLTNWKITVEGHDKPYFQRDISALNAMLAVCDRLKLHYRNVKIKCVPANATVIPISKDPLTQLQASLVIAEREVSKAFQQVEQ